MDDTNKLLEDLVASAWDHCVKNMFLLLLSGDPEVVLQPRDS